MHRKILKAGTITLFILLSTLVNAQYKTHVNEKGNGFYANPIFAGDYPDPSILRDNVEFFELYLKLCGMQVPVPQCALQGFKRVCLKYTGIVDFKIELPIPNVFRRRTFV
jgi:hypothetical protein